MGQLNAQLMERDVLIADIRAQNDDAKSLLDKTCKEKAEIAAENSALKMLALCNFKFGLIAFVTWICVFLPRNSPEPSL